MKALYRPDPALLAAFALPFCAAGFTALYTGSIWEDGLITLRQAANWVDGHGLTYNPGERVHGFTSPFNVLFLALFYKLFGQSDPLNAIHAFRLLSMVLLGATGIFTVKAFRLAGIASPVWPLAAVALFSFEIKTILFSINGQEPAFTLFFMILMICAALESRTWLMAAAIAGLQWNRPEGFVFALGLIFGDFLRLPRADWGPRFRLYVKAVPLSILFYLPWLIFTTAYYGSPIPNTIYAKGGSGTLAMALDKIPATLFQVSSSALGPVYFLSPENLTIALLSISSLGAALGLGLLPRAHPLARMGAAGSLLVFSYLCLVSATSHNYPWRWPFPWYYPPLSFCMAIALSASLAWWAQVKKFTVPMILATALILANLAIFARDCRKIHDIQQGIELSVRKEIGLWLHDEVRPGETVFCECIGYIGFYSRATILDYPGLTSRRTAELRRAQKLDFFGTLAALQTDWLVLRRIEAAKAEERGLLQDYRHVRDFDLPAGRFPELEPLADAHFRIYRKTAP